MKNLFFPILLICFAQLAKGQNCVADILVNQIPSGGFELNGSSASGVSYAWSTGASSASINIYQAGEYCVTVTDANGCSASDCYTWALTGNCGANLFQTTDSITGAPIYMATGYPYYAGPWSFVWSTGDVGPSIPYVAGQSVCVTATNPNGCVGDTCISADGCTAFITNNTGSAPLTAHSWNSGNHSYLWSTGETTQQIYPTGIGYYCVTITEPSGCASSDCIYYTDVIPLFCSLYMIGLHCSNGFYQIGAFPYDQNAPIVSYSWSNGSNGVALNVSEAGEYCVTATNSMGCTATGCYTVCDINSAYVRVLLDNDSSALSFPAEVYVIQYDTAQGGILTGIDTLLTDAQGFLLIDELPDGPFLLKAALLPGSTFYADYLPTYFPNSLFWSGATALQPLSTPDWSGGCGVPTFGIHLVPGQNPGGPGFIGGLVSQGANLQGHGSGAEWEEGDPMAGINVVLTLADGTPVAATVTNAEGAYSFENLAWGTYIITLDIPGLPLVFATLVIGPDQATFSHVDFKVDDNSVVLATNESNRLKHQIKISPNPAQDFILVETQFKSTLRLIDPQGRSLFVVRDAGLKTNIPLGQLPAGLYFLEVSIGKSIELLKIVKQ